MALGEFDLGDLLEGDEDFVVSIAQKFRMALVALLAILGRYISTLRNLTYIFHNFSIHLL